MSNQVTITFKFTLDREVTPEILQALEELAYVMDVQSEDGLFTGGHEDASPLDPTTGEEIENEHLASFTDSSFTITHDRTN